MKKSTIVILLILVLLGGCGVASYNSIVNKQEAVFSSYSDIEAQLQRRADLIPNLVSSVKGYMEHEQGIIESVTESREKLLSANGIQQLAEASDELNNAMKNLMVVVENYPDLKANTNFIQLQDELAGTENRVATARRDYNAAVRGYNAAIKRFPGKLLADYFGFEAEDYFEASEGSAEVPNVSFG